ncbi:MAG: hypothetical protein GX247_02910 [Mollicutes bacterium]|nr:hypothetical protein [Mollicutes bacterium]
MRNLYIDFDGVILDTINTTYKMLAELGIDHKDEEKTKEFYASLDWKKVLEETPIINDGINCIHKILESNKFNVAILTHVNSLDEAVQKVKYIRKYLEDITVIPVPKAISKTKMVRSKDAILIDDYSGNLREWESEGGIGVRFSLKLNGKGFRVIDKLDQILDMDYETVK